MEWTISGVVAVAALVVNLISIVAGVTAYITTVKGRLDSHDYDIEKLLKHTEDEGKHHNSEAYDEFKNNINIQFSNLNAKITEQSSMISDLRSQVQRLFNVNSR